MGPQRATESKQIGAHRQFLRHRKMAKIGGFTYPATRSAKSILAGAASSRPTAGGYKPSAPTLRSRAKQRTKKRY